MTDITIQKVQQLRQQARELVESCRDIRLYSSSMYDGLLNIAKATLWKTKNGEEPVEIIHKSDLVNLFQTLSAYEEQYPFVERFDGARVLVGEKTFFGNVVGVMYMQNGRQEIDLTVHLYNEQTYSFTGKVEKFCLVVDHSAAIP